MQPAVALGTLHACLASCCRSELTCTICCWWSCRNWSSYSRSTSRASSGELSRHSWGSMRMTSLGHGPIAIGLGASGSIPSPTAAGSGSLTRSPGQFMGSTKRRSITEGRQQQQQQQQRPASGGSSSGSARQLPGSPGQIPVAAAPSAAPATATATATAAAT